MDNKEMQVREVVLSLLEEICGDDAVRADGDINLLDEDLIDGLEIGRSYVFTIQDQEVTVPYQEWLEDPVSPEVALALYPLSYDSIRPAEEGEGGINFDHTLHLI